MVMEVRKGHFYELFDSLLRGGIDGVRVFTLELPILGSSLTSENSG